MPLSNPAPRKPIHTRKLTFNGYQREDGLFDIEGHLVDTKPFSFPNTDRGGRIQENEPLHEMRIRVTLDKHMTIRAAEAVTIWSPFNYCPGGAESFQKLVGLTIGPGWNGKVREVLGGVKGCTHITEMLAQLATTAFQSMYGVRQEGEKTYNKSERPPLLDSCHGLASDGPVVLREWPEFYQAPKEEA